MARIEWTSSLSVNIQDIDLQHRQLVELIAELQEAHAQGAAKDLMLPAFRKLNSYVREHFSTEERLLELHGYPDLITHRKLHDAFIDTLLHLDLDYLNGKVDITNDLLAFLENWFVTHVTGADQRYAEYLTEHGHI